MPPARSSKTRFMFLAFTAVLIIRFAMAVFLEGGSWPLPPAHYYAMLIDVSFTLGLFISRGEANRQAQTVNQKDFNTIALMMGTISGLGLLGIRFTSDAAWWTGYLFN
jgi:hypothetical protein